MTVVRRRPARMAFRLLHARTRWCSRKSQRSPRELRLSVGALSASAGRTGVVWADVVHRWFALDERQRALLERVAPSEDDAAAEPGGWRSAYATATVGGRCSGGGVRGHRGRPLLPSAWPSSRRLDVCRQWRPGGVRRHGAFGGKRRVARFRRTAEAHSMPYSERPVPTAAGRRSRTSREMRLLAVGDLGEGGEAARLMRAEQRERPGTHVQLDAEFTGNYPPGSIGWHCQQRLLAGAGLCTNEGEQP